MTSWKSLSYRACTLGENEPAVLYPKAVILTLLYLLYPCDDCLLKLYFYLLL
jgi:hypothetical protein